MLLVYVDDMIISGTNTTIIQNLQASLHDSFHMKYLGLVTYFLGLEVQEKWLILNQHKYAIELIDMVGLKNSTPVATPLEVNANSVKTQVILF